MKSVNISLNCKDNPNLVEYNVVLPKEINLCANNNIKTKGVCLNFLQKKYPVILRLLAKQIHFFDYKVVELESKETLDFVIIHATSDTSELFEIFKKLGISITSIQIGINWKLNKIYLNSNLFSSIYRYGDSETYNAILLYLVSLAYSLIHSNNLPPLKYDLISKDIDCEKEEDFDKVFCENTIKGFIYEVPKEENTFNITAIDFHNITSIKLVEGVSLYTENKVASGGFYSFIKITDTINNTYTVNLLFYTSLNKTIGELFRYDINKVITKSIMDLPALNPYSIEGVLSTYAYTHTIEYKEFPFEDCNGKTIELLPSEEVDYLEGINKVGINIFKAIQKILDNSNIKENTDAKSLSTFTEINIQKLKDSVDAEAIKKEYDNDSYAQELYKNVPKYYDDFDLKDLNSVLKGLVKNEIYSMLFYGDAGSGKSTAARVMLSRAGIPYVSVNFSTNTEEIDIIGTMIPNKNRTCETDPEFVWQDGILTKAVRNGYGFVGEEISFGRPGILGKLNTLLDETRQIELPTGEIVKAHKNFKFIATTNLTYEGNNQLNQAFVNRFQITKEFKMPPKSEVISILKSRTNYTNDDNINTLLTVFYGVLKYSDENNLDLVVSMRQLLDVLTIGKYFKNAKEAIENIILHNAFIKYPEYKENYIATIYNAYDLNFKF